MTIQDMIAGGSSLLLVLLTLVQIAPIKINPWSALARAFGRCINGDLCKKIDTVAQQQLENRRLLDKHISDDEAKTADRRRARILQFNNELLRDIPHTKEEFIELLNEIDAYRAYCRTHEDYPNSRAVHAIANIERVYDERLQKRDFL